MQDALDKLSGVMKLINWVVENHELLFALLGQLAAACVLLHGALKALIKPFAVLADITETQFDNKVINWVTNVLSVIFETLATNMDRIRRFVPTASLPPSKNVQPITSKKARSSKMPSSPPSIPPIGAKQVHVETLPPPVVIPHGDER